MTNALTNALSNILWTKEDTVLLEIYSNFKCKLGTLKSSTFSTGFKGISRLSSAFILLWWCKFEHISIQVTSLHKWKKQGVNYTFLIGNRFHVTLRIVSPINLNKMIGLTMRSVTWNRFPIKNLWLIPCFFHLWSEVTSSQWMI